MVGVLLPDGMLQDICGNVRHPRLRRTLGDREPGRAMLFLCRGGKFEFRGTLLIRCYQIKELLFDIHILGTGTCMCICACTVARDSQLMFQQITVFHGVASL